MFYKYWQCKIDDCIFVFASKLTHLDDMDADGAGCSVSAPPSDDDGDDEGGADAAEAAASGTALAAEATARATGAAIAAVDGRVADC